MNARVKPMLILAAALLILLVPVAVHAQTTSGTGEENTYQLAFLDLAFQIFDIFVNALVLIFQQFMTGFFGLFIP